MIYSIIISGISKKDRAFEGTIDTSKFFDKFTGNNGIFDIIRQSQFDKRETFFEGYDMSTMSPEKDEVIFFTANGLVRIIAVSSG
jgi:hypothetical protein